MFIHFYLVVFVTFTNTQLYFWRPLWPSALVSSLVRR